MPSKLHKYHCSRCTFTTFGVGLTECAHCGYKLERASEPTDAPSALHEQGNRYKEAHFQKSAEQMFRELDKYLEGK